MFICYVRSIRKGGDILDEVVAVDQKSAIKISEAKESIIESLNELPDKELMLGALAEVVDDFLQEYRQKQIKTDKTQLMTSKKTAIQADNQLKILKG